LKERRPESGGGRSSFLRREKRKKELFERRLKKYMSLLFSLLQIFKAK
jgi:hypothetical protein